MLWRDERRARRFRAAACLRQRISTAISAKPSTTPLRLLREGRLLVIFPEGYPNIDPHYTPKIHAQEMLPFKSGFAAIAAAAEKRLGASIPLVPVGIRYTVGDAVDRPRKFRRSAQRG